MSGNADTQFGRCARLCCAIASDIMRQVWSRLDWHLWYRITLGSQPWGVSLSLAGDSCRVVVSEIVGRYHWPECQCAVRFIQYKIVLRYQRIVRSERILVRGVHLSCTLATKDFGRQHRSCLAHAALPSFVVCSSGIIVLSIVYNC